MKNFDLVVVGSGPAGQKAAIQAAKAGIRVAVCEQERQVGGACVHFGTIPSKALRERAVERQQFLARVAALSLQTPDQSVSVADLIGEVGHVVAAHDAYMRSQLTRNGIEIMHGRARFNDPHELEIRFVDGNTEILRAQHVLIATGSKPRRPENVAIDHESIYDSDSILSLAYLPRSLVVLGGGVIACEYASIFAVLGVEVKLVDRYPRPLGFLDPDLTNRFLAGFERNGGVFVGEVELDEVRFDGVSQVETRLTDGTVLRSDKSLCALGRVSLIQGLAVDNAGLAVNERQLLDVDANGQTEVPHIYAAGDVVGPPSLASASMEQGRRAACHMLGLDTGRQGDWIPSGIYSVPELASVGLTEPQTVQQHGQAITGFAHFHEIARGHINRAADGMLKLVASADRVIRGVHVVGDQATDLVHIGQMALLQGATIDTFVENIFNFPTFSESYRVAALDIHGKLQLDAGQAVA